MVICSCNNCAQIKRNFPEGRGQLSELLRTSMEISKRSTNVLNIYYVSDSVVRVKNTKMNRTMEALRNVLQMVDRGMKKDHSSVVWRI